MPSRRAFGQLAPGIYYLVSLGLSQLAGAFKLVTRPLALSLSFSESPATQYYDVPNESPNVSPK
jgi:hypothetical protein